LAAVLKLIERMESTERRKELRMSSSSNSRHDSVEEIEISNKKSQHRRG